LPANNLFGMGLRHAHFEEILKKFSDDPKSLGLDFFEIITENFLETRGRPYQILLKLREYYPMSFHGVSLNLASNESIDFDYLSKLKKLENEIEPFLVSDHLCWMGTKDKNFHSLLPFPYRMQEVNMLSEKIDKIQEFLGRPLILENLSAYMQFTESEMSEAEFFLKLHKKTGCHLLLDLNNAYVNFHNFNTHWQDWYQLISSDVVKEFHLAGFSDRGEFYFDTHSNPVHDEVWKLYQDFKRKFSNAATLIEWDEDIPSFERVLEEVQKAKSYGS